MRTHTKNSKTGISVYKHKKLKWPIHKLKKIHQQLVRAMIRKHRQNLNKEKEEIIKIKQMTNDLIVKTNETISKTKSIMEALGYANQALTATVALTEATRRMALLGTKEAIATTSNQ
jgi:transcription initiation factor IIF auxiliary subunit